MKITSVILLIFLYSLPAVAQLSTKDIIKNKVKKSTAIMPDNFSGKTITIETWYNRRGEDSVEFMYGKPYQTYSYEYDSIGRVSKKMTLDDKGAFYETDVFVYNADGSFTKFSDDFLGLHFVLKFDANGNYYEQILGEGDTVLYIYDKAGCLEKSIDRKKDKAPFISAIYTCNKEGKTIAGESFGAYAETFIYKYNNKGLISSMVRTSKEAGNKTTTVRYVYEFYTTTSVKKPTRKT